MELHILTRIDFDQFFIFAFLGIVTEQMVLQSFWSQIEAKYIPRDFLCCDFFIGPILLVSTTLPFKFDTQLKTKICEKKKDPFLKGLYLGSKWSFEVYSS